MPAVRAGAGDGSALFCFLSRGLTDYNAGMSTVEEIKMAIEKLSDSERADIARFVNGREDDAWDEQIKRDYDAGKLDALLKQVDAEIDAGHLEDGP
jgi:hypothetical protein